MLLLIAIKVCEMGELFRMKSRPGISAVASKMIESHEMAQFSVDMLDFNFSQTVDFPCLVGFSRDVGRSKH